MFSLVEVKKRLMVDRERLRAEIAEAAARPATYAGTEDSYYGNHLADTATDIFEEEKAIALEAHLVGLLGKIEGAIERIDAGTYGICDRCGQPIALERLEALPYATTCVSCSSGAPATRALGAS